MIRRFEQSAQNERWNAMTARRADAMSQHFELTTGHGAPEVDRPVYSAQGPPRIFQTERADWLRALDIVKKHWRLSVMFAAAVIGSVTAFTLMMKPMYEPQARVEVDPPGAEVFSLQGNNNSGAATDYMETQAQNLQDDELTLDVIRKLHLDQSPYFGADPNAVSGEPKPTTDVAVPLTPAENKALYVFKQHRKISRDAASRLITVSVSASNPLAAAAVTNTLVSMFIERDYALRNNAISQSSKWLQSQLEDIRQRMDDSNRALNRFETDNGIGAIGADNQNRFSEEMAELSRQLIQAQADRIQLQSYLSEMNGVQDSSLPQINNNPVVQELTKRLAEVKGEIAETKAIYGASHPNTKKLQNEADELQSQLKAERAEILRDLKTSYTAAQAREHLTQSQMAGASKQMAMLAQYNALKKESDANTQLYQALYQKIKEAAIGAETKSSNIRVVDRARVLDRPTRPHRGQDIGIGILVGILGGIAIAFLREGTETRVRTPEDVKRCLGVTSVSVVPVISNGGPATQVLPWQRLPSNNPQENTLFQINRPNSPEGEALRSICVSVRLSRQNARTPQVLLVVSPLTGEGKTTLSVNLALTLAQHGRTCIVDADLRKEGVAQVLGIEADYGIREVLSEAMGVDQVIVSAVQLPNLSLLAPGSARGKPGEMLSSNAMLELMGKLRQRFQYIVMDSPPMLMFTDGRALSTLADGVIVVGRAGVTTRANLKRTIELLAGVRSAPVVDLVLNAAEYTAMDYNYYGRYHMAG